MARFSGGKPVIEHKTRVLIFSATSIRYISHSNKKGAIYQLCIFVSMWNTRYSCQILIKLEYLDRFLKKYWNKKVHVKIRLVGAELFHANGRTDKQT
jgi:hypothetical protein